MSWVFWREFFRRRDPRYLVVFVCCLSCTEEIGRISFSKTQPQDYTVNLKEGDLDFWVALDVEFENRQKLGYRIEAYQNGRLVDTQVCDAFDISTKMMSVETSFSGKVSKSYDGKMRCGMDILDPGAFKLAVTPLMEPKPLKLEKFDLVLKQ